MANVGRLFGWTGASWVAMKLDSTGRMIIDQALGGGGAGAPAWLAPVKPAIATALRIVLAPVAQNVALALDAGRNALRIGQNPAFAVAATATGTVKPAQNPALLLGARISDFKLPQLPAAEMVRVQYNLTRDVGGNAQAAVGTAWTNPGNAINGTDGRANGTPFATCVGALGATTFGIELSYLNSVDKSALVISSATLKVYMNVVDATGLLADTVISYNIGAGLVTLDTIAGAFTNIVTPRSYVLPITTWTQFDALQARVIQDFAAVGQLANASLDAIQIEVVAAYTDNLS